MRFPRIEMVKIHCVVTYLAFGQSRTPANEFTRLRTERSRFFDLQRDLLSFFNTGDPAHQALVNCLWPEQLDEVLADLGDRHPNKDDVRRYTRQLADSRNSFLERYDAALKSILHEARERRCRLYGGVNFDPRAATHQLAPAYCSGNITIGWNWCDIGPCHEGRLPGQILFTKPTDAPVFYDVRMSGEQANELLLNFSTAQLSHGRCNRDDEIKLWFVGEYVPEMVRLGKFPNRDDDAAAASERFPDALKVRGILRSLRTEFAPEEWKKPGPRGNR